MLKVRDACAFFSQRVERIVAADGGCAEGRRHNRGGPPSRNVSFPLFCVVQALSDIESRNVASGSVTWVFGMLAHPRDVRLGSPGQNGWASGSGPTSQI